MLQSHLSNPASLLATLSLTHSTDTHETAGARFYLLNRLCFYCLFFFCLSHLSLIHSLRNGALQWVLCLCYTEHLIVFIYDFTLGQKFSTSHATAFVVIFSLFCCVLSSSTVELCISVRHRAAPATHTKLQLYKRHRKFKKHSQLPANHRRVEEQKLTKEA